MLQRWIRELDSRLNLGYLAYQLFREEREIRSYLEETGENGEPLRFSIILPTYGIKLLYLREAVESIFRQAYKNWELCICDDADPDPSIFPYLRSLADRYPERIRLIRHENNRGICAATKSAMSLASGDFLVFMDADDLLHPRAFQAISATLLRAPDCDFLYTNYDVMTEWGLRKEPFIKPAWSPELLLHVNYVNHLKVVRRTLLAECGRIFEDDTNGAQDWDLCLALGNHARRVIHLPFFLYHWRARPGSIAHHYAAKPWAFNANQVVRSRFIENMRENLRFDHEADAVDASAEMRDHPRFRPLLFWLDPGMPVAEICSFLEKRCEEQTDDRIVCLLLTGKNEIAGNLRSLAAYAHVPGVGAVWPFLRPGTRTTLTIGESAGTLAPVLDAGSMFSGTSGNILTGPLHGMTLKIGRLKAALSTLKQSPGTDLTRLSDPDALGASLGLQLLSLGHRNVSVSVATCEQKLHPVVIAATLMPTVDPYI